MRNRVKTCLSAHKLVPFTILAHIQSVVLDRNPSGRSSISSSVPRRTRLVLTCLLLSGTSVIGTVKLA